MAKMVSQQKYRSQKAVKITKQVLTYIFLTIISIIWIIPFIYLLSQSFISMEGRAAGIDPYSFGQFFPTFGPTGNFTFNNYVTLFNDPAYPFITWWVNTLIIAIVSSILQTILTLLTSYTLSRLRFKGRQGIMKLILVLGMFPGFLGMIINYYILDLLGLTSSIFSLILLYISGSMMNYYISKGFFDTISKSLDEAVLIDGGTNNTVFWRIIMPLSKPIIVYTILISFTGPWGDYMMAAYLAHGNQEMFNVAVGLQQMLEKGAGTYFTTFCAGAVFVSIPIMILFFILQRYYVEGIAGGAVKG